jgi:hypothetical protein
MNYRGQNFLFLQALATPFFATLENHLRGLGAETIRVDLCAGPDVYWRDPAITFRSPRKIFRARGLVTGTKLRLPSLMFAVRSESGAPPKTDLRPATPSTALRTSRPSRDTMFCHSARPIHSDRSVFTSCFRKNLVLSRNQMAHQQS